MKILFCGNAPIVEYLGASKVLIELADAMQREGWTTEIVGPDTFDQSVSDYPAALRGFLVENSDRYDVIDFDHEIAPFSREEFSTRPLFVARSVLLVHHLPDVKMPRLSGLRPVAGKIVYGRKRRNELLSRVERARRTIAQADLVNVPNSRDKAELVNHGVPADKVVVLPFGLSESKRELFDRQGISVPAKPVVSFVGSFDQRKGAPDFPRIVDVISTAIPEARFVLLGTQGLLRTADDVRRQFPRRLRGLLEIHERFEPVELPQLLGDASVGIFPSYVEGFGFGVLEMLAAGVPVIAYDAPGPPMMLPDEWLVPRGDAGALGRAVVGLLHDPGRLAAERVRAKSISQEFSWSAIGKETSEVYLRARDRRSGAHQTPQAARVRLGG